MTRIACVLAALTFGGPLLAQQSLAPATRDNVTVELVRQKADSHGIDRQDALRKYQQVFDPDSVKSLSAVEFFDKKDASDILALALPKLSGPGRTAVTDLLVGKRALDAPAVDALIKELERLNGEEPVNDEEYSGQMLMKDKVSKAIAQALGLPAPSFPRVGPLSKEPLAVFIAQAKAKLATMPSGSPRG